jgi:hypothetical protein
MRLGLIQGRTSLVFILHMHLCLAYIRRIQNMAAGTLHANTVCDGPGGASDSIAATTDTDSCCAFMVVVVVVAVVVVVWTLVTGTCNPDRRRVTVGRNRAVPHRDVRTFRPLSAGVSMDNVNGAAWEPLVVEAVAVSVVADSGVVAAMVRMPETGAVAVVAMVGHCNACASSNHDRCRPQCACNSAAVYAWCNAEGDHIGKRSTATP